MCVCVCVCLIFLKVTRMRLFQTFINRQIKDRGFDKGTGFLVKGRSF